MTTAPAPRSSRATAIAPYRVLFPFGVLYAIAGAVVWLLVAPGWIPYPGPLHRELMIEGFELSFVCGFLLTAMIGFLHVPRADLGEVVAVAFGLAGFGVAACCGKTLVAQVCAFEALGVTVAALVRRVPRRTGNPPEEFVFVAFGLLCGLGGIVMLALSAAGVADDPSPNFGGRLLSLGMVLSLVLGLGTLLVPPFAGIPRGLELPGLAGAHERRGRRPFYFVLVLLLAGAFVADARWAFGVGARTDMADSNERATLPRGPAWAARLPHALPLHPRELRKRLAQPAVQRRDLVGRPLRSIRAHERRLVDTVVESGDGDVVRLAARHDLHEVLAAARLDQVRHVVRAVVAEHHGHRHAVVQDRAGILRVVCRQARSGRRRWTNRRPCLRTA